jgi:hypothetical protein
MLLHTDVLTADHLLAAAERAGVTLRSTDDWHRSRSRARAVDITLYGRGNRGGHYGALGANKSGTWDEYGMFLAALYAIEGNANMRVNSGTYEHSEHFQWATGERYTETFTPSDVHLRHKWESVFGSGVSGLYGEQVCECGALRCHLWHKRVYDDVASYYDWPVTAGSVAGAGRLQEAREQQEDLDRELRTREQRRVVVSSPARRASGTGVRDILRVIDDLIREDNEDTQTPRAALARRALIGR